VTGAIEQLYAQFEVAHGVEAATPADGDKYIEIGELGAGEGAHGGFNTCRLDIRAQSLH
jgi:hypothetical protein